MPVAGENGLAVVQNQGDIAVFQGAEFEKQPIMLFKAQLLPLIRIHLMEKRPARMMRDLLQDREQGVGVGFEHCYTNE
jgi:hypothetical protein